MNHPEINRLVNRHRDLTACRTDLQLAWEKLRDAVQAGALLLVAGAGNSTALASHFATGLRRPATRPRPVPAGLGTRLASEFGPQGERLAAGLHAALPAISLQEDAAWTHGLQPDTALAQQVYSLGRQGDLLLLISSGGDTPSLDNALRVARATGMTSIALTDREGGSIRNLADTLVRVPRVTRTEVEELHLPVLNAYSVMLEQEFFT